MQKKKGRDIAVRPHTIIEARFTLSQSQNDLLDLILTKMGDKDDDKLVYSLAIKDYKHLFPPGEQKNIYRDLESAVRSFEGQGFRVWEDEKKETFYHWFSSMEYQHDKGIVELELSSKLKRVLLDMKRAAYYNAKYPLSLQSAYAKRIYYVMKEYEGVGGKTYDLDTLREMLECSASYNKFGLFRTRVLEIAKKQINANTDINIDYIPIYVKNKVTHIRFEIQSKDIVEGSYYVNPYQIKDPEYQQIIKQVSILLGDDLKECAEEYIRWQWERMDQNKYNKAKYKRAYLHKVMTAKDNISEFIDSKKIEDKKTLAQIQAQKELERYEEEEREKSKREAMEKYGVESEAELFELLQKQYTGSEASFLKSIENVG